MIGMVQVIENFSKLRKLWKIDGEPMEVERNIFPGFNTLQLSKKSNIYCWD